MLKFCMSFHKKADFFLKKHNIPFTPIQQTKSTTKCYESAKERGIRLRNIVKSMILQPKETKFVQCILPGSHHLNSEKFEKETLLNFSFASAEDVEIQTGFKPGSVHPFVPIPQKFIDKRVMEVDKISFNVGNPSMAVIIEPSNLYKALQMEFGSENVKICDICTDPMDEIKSIAEDFGISIHDAKFLLDLEGGIDYYSKVMSIGGLQVKECITWMRDLVRFAEMHNKDYKVVHPEWFVKILSQKATKFVKTEQLQETMKSEKEPIIEEIKSDVDLKPIMERVIKENPKSVEQYKQGKKKVLNFLIGQVMKYTKGKVDPNIAKEELLKNI